MNSKYLSPTLYREFLRNDLASFIERSFYELNPGADFIQGKYIGLLAATLEKVRLGEIKRLIVNLPPRTLKSHAASVAFPAWLLGHKPSTQIICASYGQDLAEKHGRDTRTWMESAAYRDLFPSTVLSPTKMSVNDFMTTAQGCRMATSVGGALTGRGADVLIVDDPLKPEDALSEPRRRAANDWYFSTLLSRLNSKKDGAIIIVMQRLHQQDLVGEVTDREHWDVLSLPAIATRDEIYEYRNLFGPDTFTRKAGEALHPERDSVDVYLAIRAALGEYNFQKVHIPKRNHISEAKSSATKSTRYYDPQTLKLLWGRAAGRCAMADCRIELFVTEADYDPVCVIGEMGHIAASSDAGPRANVELQSRDRDKYENLILLCRNCHRKVDTLKRSYPEERLLEIKSSHEAWVRTALPERGFTNLRWNVLRLQGDFPFDPTTIAEALSPDQEEDVVQVSVSATNSSWASIQQSLQVQVQAMIAKNDPVSSRVAVFALAPVSACIYTGYLLTNRINVRGFQYQRDQATWAWPKDPQAITMPSLTEPAQPGLSSAEVFFLFELTAPINASEVLESTEGDLAVYRCSVPDVSTAWLKSKTQLDELARKAREMFESASIRYPHSQRWHILYAGPAPGGIVVGQQLNPTMIPTVRLYEFQRPRHIPSITITPQDSSLTSWTAESPLTSNTSKDVPT